MLDSTRAIAVAALKRERYELEHEYQRYEDWLSVEPLSAYGAKEFERVQEQRDAVDVALADLAAPDATGVAQWVPLSDGDYTYQVQRGQYYLVRVEDEGSVIEAGFTDEFFATNFIRLDSGHRLCKRVQHAIRQGCQAFGARQRA